MRRPWPQSGLVQVTLFSSVFWRHLGDIRRGGAVGGEGVQDKAMIGKGQ
jgi:hypothetical protein